jgi:hypothetical protein
MINLSITEADRMPATMVTSRVKQWSVAPGVVPSAYDYFRIRGGQGYIIGVPTQTATRLLKEKDPAKLRKMMAALILPEMQAARSGMTSPGKMILLMQSGDSISQVTSSAPGMGKRAGMPFLKQDRPERVKKIFRALKREHPEMPAEMKARIAARQGKPGKQHQGPPYKGPIHDRER